MIPVKLTMRHFMCYRDAPSLHFDGMHTACICGDNGSGKSALIDAITWALWGKTRATRSDDDLIHSTQTEMQVEFDFAVGQQIYRVIRKHSRPKRRQASGQSSLDLLIASNGGFRVVSGDRIRETEQKIRDILHMDYDTFVNSAFLRQGHADEFTRQPPTMRKEVLASILGLSIYDSLEEQARGLARERETEKSQLESTITEIDNELAQKPLCQAQLEQANGELTDLERTITEQQAKLEQLRGARESLEKKELQLAQLTTHMAEIEGGLKRWEEQIHQHHSRLKEYEELIAQRATIEAGYAQLTQARKLNNELEQKLRQLAVLNEHRHKLEMAIERAQSNLLTEHRLTQNRIAELEAKSQKIPQFQSELQQLQSQWHQLAREEETLRQQKQGSQELQTRVSYLEPTIAQLELEIEDIKGKLRLLATQSDAKCPLCERELGKESLTLIEQKYTNDSDNKLAALKTNQAELAVKKAELKSLETEVSRLETTLGQKRAKVQGTVSFLTQQVAEAEQARSKLDEEGKRLGEIEKRLASKDFATGEQQTLAGLEEELAKLNYEPQQHEQVRRQLADLEPCESSQRKLEEAGRLISQERESVSQAEQASKELRLSLEAGSQRKQALSKELSLMPQIINNLTQAETAHQALVKQRQQIAEVVWGIKAKLQRCEELEEKRKIKGNLMSQAIAEEQVYKDLAQAFGKEGIQAMLIEMAVPEIELEANRLLGRMTDNRMHVKIETQRETKRGNVAETLDINISDEMGLRSYEMFSGGEAFRIDFAVRIALSRLLARRAGAPLPTLIIDEGFGTQDTSGIEKLKEAINSIQDDFDKILVITHIEELKDAFPTRIDVIKTANGSTLEVS